MTLSVPIHFLVWCVVGLCSTFAVAASDRAIPIELHTIDGTILNGLYAGVDAGALLVMVDEAVRPVRLDDLHRVVFNTDRRPMESPAGTAEFRLADGGGFVGEIVGAADGGVEVRTAFAGSMTIEFEHLASLWCMTESESARAREVFEAELAARLPGKDVLITRAGDEVRTVRGTVLSLGPTAGQFLHDGRERTFSTRSVHGVVFAPGTAAKPASARLCLVDGALLPSRLLASDAQSLIVETSFGARLELRPGGIVEIVLVSDRVVYLSDIDPLRLEVRGLLHAPWPVRRDASVANQPIRLDGRVYEKGLGVHSRTELVYALDGAFARFRATIGIDDAARPRGQVVFRVLGDGRELLNSGSVTGRDSARELTIDVSGVKELTLLTEYGARMDLADHADWAEVRLIRPPSRRPESATGLPGP